MSEPRRAEGCACGVTHEHGPHERELPEVLAWRVTADGSTVGTFDNFEDAEGMASAWNTAYPHDPWFKVVADLPAASTPEERCARCGNAFSGDNLCLPSACERES